MKKQTTTILRTSSILALIAGLLLQLAIPQAVNASQIVNRQLTLQAGTTDGGSKPGGSVKHFFEFTVPTTATAIGSVKFEYCTTAANSIAVPSCVTPTGLTSTGSTLGSEAGSGATGFTLDNSTNGTLLLTKATAAVPSNGDLKFRFDSVVNPGPQKGTFFVRVSTFNSIDGTGTAIDSGTVTASTAEPIILDGTMPESLVFCTGATISLTASVPDCSTATSGLITFNQLFSPTDTAIATSQMAASTNAGFGYIVTVNGPTMTSGSNTITGIATPAASLKGNSQFGLNLRANTTAAASSFPAGSADISVTSDGTNFNGRPVGDYATADTFAYNTGAIVADSNYDATSSPDPSDSQIYTSSYIVNVTGNQPAGTYTTTLTYICTPTF